MGALAGGIIAGLGSLVGAGISSASSAANTATAMLNSKEENEKQRNWASQEATIANQRNMENWREQFSAQTQQALKMFDTYNQYNSPAAVVERLRQAGFNPAAYFQQGSGQGMSNFTNLSAPSAAPAPASVPSAGMMAFNTQPSTLNFTEAFEGLARAYESFASAKEKSTNAQRTTMLLGEEMKLMIEQTKNKELLNAFQEVENWYQGQNLPNRVERALQETQEIASKVVFNKSAAEYNDARTLTEAFKRLNEEMDYSLKGEELARSKTLTNYFEAQLLAQIDATRASAQESRAVAENQHQQALTEDALRGYKDIIMDSEAYKSYVLRDSQIDAARKAIETSNVLSDADKEEGLRRLRRVQDENNANGSGAWRAFDSFSEWVLNKGQKVNIPFIFTRNTNSK